MIKFSVRFLKIVITVHYVVFYFIFLWISLHWCCHIKWEVMCWAHLIFFPLKSKSIPSYAKKGNFFTILQKFNHKTTIFEKFTNFSENKTSFGIFPLRIQHFCPYDAQRCILKAPIRLHGHFSIPLLLLVKYLME